MQSSNTSPKSWPPSQRQGEDELHGFFFWVVFFTAAATSAVACGFRPRMECPPQVFYLSSGFELELNPTLGKRCVETTVQGLRNFPEPDEDVPQ